MDIPQHTVQCIGIVLDGNRRWARERGLPTQEGHRKGAEHLKTIARAVRDRGIPHLAIFAFSTENWNRSQEEVGYLMMLIEDMVGRELRNLAQEGVRIRVVGQRSRFSSHMQDIFNKVEKESIGNQALTLWLCLSYGGRAEIVDAAQKAAETGEVFTEESLSRHRWTAEMPDPDIIIRTGGEQRLSGFLTWGSIYSELFFVHDHWPAFTEAHLDAILGEYATRQRRYGT